MKPLTLALLVFMTFTLSVSLAQERPDTSEKNKEKMLVFKDMVGNWKGDGNLQKGRDSSQKSLVDENVQTKLDGMLLVVEGTGKLADGSGKVVHHAFGVLSYDALADQYKFRAYLVDGRSADAWFNVVGENKFQWGFDVPGGKIRYTIVIDAAAKTWNETGEFSRDEKTWFKTFEMNLKKV